MGGSTGDGQIDGGGFCCAKSMVGGLTYEWVLKDGLAVGGLAAAVGRCVGCGGSMGGGGCVLILVGLFIYLFIFLRWCWWMWVCVDGGCRRCCSLGGCAVVFDDDDDDGEVV